MRKFSVFDVIVMLAMIAGVIWVFVNIGFNFFGILFSLIIMAIAGAIFGGENEAKANQYLANKYDEEYKNKK